MTRITQRLVRARLIEWLRAPPALSGLVDEQDRSHMVLESIPEDQEFITEAFRRVLGRDPELDAIQHYSLILKSHPRRFVVDCLVEAAGTAQALAAEPAGSIQDLTVLGQIDSPAQFVHDMYRSVLGRTCDLAGFTHFRNLLLCGVPRQDVLALIAASPEARGRNLRFTWQGYPLPPPPRLSLKTRLRMFVRGLLSSRQIDAVEHSLCLVGGQTRLIAAGQRHLSAEQGASAARTDTQNQKVLDGLSAIDSAVRSTSPRLDEAELRVEALAARAQLHNEAVRQKLDSIATDVERQRRNLQTSLDACRMEIAKERPQLSQEDIHRRLDAIASDVEALQGRLQTALDALLGRQERIEQMIRPPVLTGADVLVAKVNDFVLAFPREDWVHAAHCAFWGTVEQGFTKHLRSVLRPGMVFVDVGANVGIHTLHAARVVGAAGRVHSFEPAPRTFNILKQNVVANNFECVDLYPIAVLDKKARVPLYLNEGFSGLNSIFSNPGSANSIYVEAMTLDEALGNIGHIDIVKIDAEGAEPLILRGMAQILRTLPRLVIFIEFAPQHLQRAGISPAEFLESLYSAGFDIERVDALTGELSAAQPGQLLSAYSENLRLQKR